MLKRVISVLSLLLAPLLGVGVFANVIAQSDGANESVVIVAANLPWTDTGIDLEVGSLLTITASGSIANGQSDEPLSPSGDISCEAGFGNIAPGFPCWALVGQIGDRPPFLVGESLEFIVEDPGRLYLGVNDDLRQFADNGGQWDVTIAVGIATTSGPASEVVESVSSVTTFRGNSARTGEMPGPGPDGRPQELWSFEIDGGAGSGIVVDGQLAFVGSGAGTVYAIDRSTGEEAWRFATNEHIDATPALSEGALVVASREGNLYCLDAATGQPRWRFPTGTGKYGAGVFASPVVENGMAFVNTINGDVIAVNVMDGSEIWRTNIGGTLFSEGSSPAIDGETIFVGSASRTRIIALDRKTGNPLWDYDPGESRVSRTPAVADGLVVFVEDHGKMYGVDGTSGQPRWEVEGFDIESSPALSNGVVYALTVFDRNRSVTAFDSTNGTVRWSTEVEIESSPVVADGLVYFSTPDGLAAVSAEDGAGTWRIVRESLGHVSEPIVVDGVILVGMGNEVVAWGSPSRVPSSVNQLYRGDAARSGEMAGPGPVAPPHALWQIPIENTLGSVIANGLVVTAGQVDRNLVLIAVDPATGEEIWRVNYGNCSRTCYLPPPTVLDGSIVTNSTNRGIAVDSASGSTLWTNNVGSTSLAVWDGSIYGANSSSSSVGIVSCDAILGSCEELWYDVGEEPTNIAVYEGKLYFGTDTGNLVAIDATSLEVAWIFPAVTGVGGAPAIRDNLVVFGTEDGTVYGVDATTGDERWRFTAGGAVFTDVAISSGSIYVGAQDGTLYAVDAENGDLRWSFGTDGPINSSPVVSGGLVYVGSDDGSVYAVDVRTGQQRWSFDTGGPVIGSPLVFEGTLFVGSADGYLYALSDA